MPDSELPRGLLWSSFLDELAEKVDPEAVVMSPKRIVAWRDGDALNRLELLRWTWPDSRFPRAPRVTRMGLNTQRFIPPKTLLHRFGFEPWSRPPGAPQLHLEWSVLGEELLAFAAWLPLWIRGRLDPSAAIPLPPHPSHVFGESLRTTSYAWTVAAWEAYSRWHKQDPRLPWYAIPAPKLAPATPELRSA